VRGCEITSARLLCSHLHVGSLGYRNIGDAGSRDLGAALRVNMTLTKLE
jgi:hypothetical protein